MSGKRDVRSFPGLLTRLLGADSVAQTGGQSSAVWEGVLAAHPNSGRRKSMDCGFFATTLFGFQPILRCR
jgi:hypothetical protein